MKAHLGSCHCGVVRFEVQLDLSNSGASRCNCTICTKAGLTGANVKPDAFRLLAGETELVTYEHGHKVSKRYFCRTCGMHAFARGHLEVLGGAFVSINVNCLDDVDVGKLELKYWDGRHDNWMAGPRAQPWPIA
jgi:hypothetical protein